MTHSRVTVLPTLVTRQMTTLDSDLHRLRGRITLKVTGDARFADDVRWADVPMTGGVIGRAPHVSLHLEHAPKRVSREHCAIEPREGACWTVVDTSTHGTAIRYQDGSTATLVPRVPTILPSSSSLILGGVVELVAEIVRPPAAGTQTEGEEDNRSLPSKPKLSPDQFEFARQITSPRRTTPPSFHPLSLEELATLRNESTRTTRRRFKELAGIPAISRQLTLEGETRLENRAELADVLLRFFPALSENQGEDGLRRRPGPS
jgi:predicted component of type VI protein secretion system